MGSKRKIYILKTTKWYTLKSNVGKLKEFTRWVDGISKCHEIACTLFMVCFVWQSLIKLNFNDNAVLFVPINFIEKSLKWIRNKRTPIVQNQIDRQFALLSLKLVPIVCFINLQFIVCCFISQAVHLIQLKVHLLH